MKRKYANSALPRKRTATTFAVQMLKDQQKKLELAQRMRQAWEESGRPQQAIADAVGLKLRSYTKALQTGGSSYDKLLAMAEFLEVDFDWLLKGDQGVSHTPDMIESMNGDGPTNAQLDAKLDRVLSEVSALKRSLNNNSTP